MEQNVILKKNYTPMMKNMIDLCRCKAYIWAQYLAAKKIMTFEHYHHASGFHIDLDNVLSSIKIHELQIEPIYQIFDVIVHYNNQVYFIFKIIKNDNKILEKETIANIEKNLINGKPCYVYPEFISFHDKPKSMTKDGVSIGSNAYDMNKLYVNVKCILRPELLIKEIYLIHSEQFAEIKTNSSSPYDTQRINTETTTLTDISYLFFQHPEHCPISSIYGFKYNHTMLNVISESGYRFKASKKTKV